MFPEPFYTYLCGPMNNCTIKEMSSWRNYIKDRLGDCLDPVTGLGKNSIYDYNSGKLKPEEIINHDLADITKSMFLIVYYDPSKPMVGSSMEIFFAKNKIIPSYVFTIVPDKSKVSPWLLHFSTKVFEISAGRAKVDLKVTLDKVIELIKRIKCYLQVTNTNMKDTADQIKDLINERK